MCAKLQSSFRRESGLRERAREKMPRKLAEWGSLSCLSFASRFALRANARTFRLNSPNSSVRSGNVGKVRDLLADRDGFEPAVRFACHMSRKQRLNLPLNLAQRKLHRLIADFAIHRALRVLWSGSDHEADISH